MFTGNFNLMLHEKDALNSFMNSDFEIDKKDVRHLPLSLKNRLITFMPYTLGEMVRMRTFPRPLFRAF